MSEQPCQVPLIEQLRSTPLNAHHFVELANNAGYRNIPFGPWCHAAADEIDRLHQDVRRYESGRVVLTGMVEELTKSNDRNCRLAELRIAELQNQLISEREEARLQLQQVTLERDGMLERIAEQATMP